MGVVSSSLPERYHVTCTQKWKRSYKTHKHKMYQLLFTVGKVFNCIMNNRIVAFLEVGNIICDEQIGFRCMHACLNNLCVICTVIISRKKANQYTYACFIEFMKAFDPVNHDLILLKCLSHCIDGKFLRYFQNLYTKYVECMECME